jgi:hypothetical protein
MLTYVLGTVRGQAHAVAVTFIIRALAPLFAVIEVLRALVAVGGLGPLGHLGDLDVFGWLGLRSGQSVAGNRPVFLTATEVTVVGTLRYASY